MNAKLPLLIISIACFWIAGCTPEGIGGNASITGHITHHNDVIAGAVVYIKYGADELPGIQASDYDDQFKVDSLDIHYYFEGLQKGSYYLYSKAYDRQVADSVFGGIHIKLKADEEMEIDIPVTE